MVGHIYIYGDIGNTGFDNGSGFVELEDVMAQVSKNLRNGPVTSWLVHIKSPGGLKTTGDAIYNYLLSLRKEGVIVNTITDGDVGSIATKIFLAGQNRTIVGNYEFFIHNPWIGPISGEARDMEESAQELRNMEKELAKFYAEITGHTADGILELMEKGTGVRGSMAVDLGFATEHTQAVQTKAFVMMKPAEQPVEKKKSIKKAKKMSKYKKFASILNEIKSLLQVEDVKNIDLPLQDGTSLRVTDAENEEMAVGKMASLVAADGTESPAPAGEYIMADGRMVMIDEQSMVVSVSAEMSEVEALKAKVKELEAKLGVEEPVAEQIDVEQLSNTLVQMKEAIEKNNKEKQEYLALQEEMRNIKTQYNIPENKTFNKAQEKQQSGSLKETLKERDEKRSKQKNQLLPTAKN